MLLNNWTINAIDKIERDFQRSADTHLIPLSSSPGSNINLYIKDESTHPTGSLKHRLARSLFLYALCNGQISEGTTITEASSGSTAVSEAYFARLLGLPFIAVMPRTTSKIKVERIEELGGSCHLIEDPSAIYSESERLAKETHGVFLDQFTYAERASEWAGDTNIASSVLTQMGKERFRVPRWIVIGAGTGGTSATFGRHCRLAGFDTEICVADPEGSAYAPAWENRDLTVTAQGPRLEGIDRKCA